MTQLQIWHRVYYLLSAVFVATAALNMLHVRAGFLTNYTADIVVPAWLYVALRGYAPGGRRGTLGRVFGRSPAVTALTLFAASTLTEVTQLFWPGGVFRGTFDPLDIIAFAAGLGACYLGDRILLRRLPNEELKPPATPGSLV
jgi:hypothetical protein